MPQKDLFTPIRRATFIYRREQIQGMYQAAGPIQIGTYGDHWRKGRYRAELSARLEADLERVDTVLTRLGYHIVDADQYGWSYLHHRRNHGVAELDELECEGGPVRLILSQGDLDETQTEAAEQELVALYAQIAETLERYVPGLAPAECDVMEHYLQTFFEPATREEEV